MIDKIFEKVVDIFTDDLSNKKQRNFVPFLFLTLICLILATYIYMNNDRNEFYKEAIEIQNDSYTRSYNSLKMQISSDKRCIIKEITTIILRLDTLKSDHLEIFKSLKNIEKLLGNSFQSSPPLMSPE